MNRLHIHLNVRDIDQSVRFYSALFGAEPVKLEPDYAKWMLEDPRVNFAISARGGEAGLSHLGIQVDNAPELAKATTRAKAAAGQVLSRKGQAAATRKATRAGPRIHKGCAGKPF